MSIFQAIILGIVEGVTEFLPISSTGHLILANNLLGLNQDEFAKTFEIAIQLGAILSVVFLYGRSLLINFSILKRLAVAFLPTALIGLTFYNVIKNVFFESNQIILWALFLGGIGLIMFEYWHKEPEQVQGFESITYKQSFLIGLAQSVAIIPGVSRAAATIVGGLLLGLNRKTIVEFSFLLAVPTMLAATGLDLYNSYDQFNSSQFGVLAVGFVVSFIVAIAAIKFLLKFIETHNFKVFGIYRIIIALAFWFLIL